MKTNEWTNYGDVNFLDYGGCLIRNMNLQSCDTVYEAIILARLDDEEEDKNYFVYYCTVDIADSWIKSCGMYDKERDLSTEEGRMDYAVDVLEWYDLEEFNPEFPNNNPEPVTRAEAIEFITGSFVPEEMLYKAD